MEEDTTQDSEVEHIAERVDYLAVQGDGMLTATCNILTRDSDNGTYTQAWDVENRLITVANPSLAGATAFSYDANGLRTKTEQPNGVIKYTPFPGFEVEQWPEATEPPTITITANNQSPLSVNYGDRGQRPFSVNC